MDAHLVETTIKAYLTVIRNRLDKAAGIGQPMPAPVLAFMRKVLRSLSTSSSYSMRQQRC